MHMRHVAPLVLLSLFAVLLVACFSGPAPPQDLLLGPEDFRNIVVTETNREGRETNLDEPAVQVELTSPDFTLLESLVLFEDEDIALTILAGIKQDQISQGVTPEPMEGFEDNSGVLSEKMHGEDASTLFFVEGRVLVRITLSGDGQADDVWVFARLARKKTGS